MGASATAVVARRGRSTDANPGTPVQRAATKAASTLRLVVTRFMAVDGSSKISSEKNIGQISSDDVPPPKGWFQWLDDAVMYLVLDDQRNEFHELLQKAVDFFLYLKLLYRENE